MNYYILTMRYICHHCRKMMKESYTHHAYHPTSVECLPRCLGLRFPALLTHKYGLDKSIIDLMRPIMDSGMKINTFRELIMELHSKEHARLAILHEWEGFNIMSHYTTDGNMFSPFDIVLLI